MNASVYFPLEKTNPKDIQNENFVIIDFSVPPSHWFWKGLEKFNNVSDIWNLKQKQKEKSKIKIFDSNTFSTDTILNKISLNPGFFADSNNQANVSFDSLLDSSANVNNSQNNIFTVPGDNDNDGILDGVDLDDDNDGILDTVENASCGVPNPSPATGNGAIINTLFTENFGTMSGSTSVTLAGVGTGATTTYNYFGATATVPTNSADGSGPPNSLQDGRYTVFNNIQRTSSWAASIWQNLGDHTGGSVTPGTDRMYIVNASLTAGEFYRRTLTGVVQGVPINASLWAMNLDTDIAANNGRNVPNITVNFVQSGSVVYTFNTANLARSPLGDFTAWKFFKNPTIFVPTSTAPIDIVLVNNSPGGSGNDLAIDDIVIYQAMCDTDNDGIANYLDPDSDNDGCSDTNEAYGNSNTDTNGDGTYGGVIGAGQVGSDGRVTGASYPGTNSNVTTATSITSNTNPSNVSANIAGTANFAVTATAATTSTITSGTPNYTIPPATNSSASLTYQWQINAGSGWINVTNGGTNPTYSNATTATLGISQITNAMNGYLYRAIIKHSNNVCASVTSASATLCVRPSVPTIASAAPTCSSAGTSTISN
ncbi:MAG: hypothetical protein ABI657_18720, partial [Flavobacterium sp.]